MAARATAPEVADALREIADSRSFADELKSERLVSALEQKILSGRLPAGARLPTEGELCDYLHVSRSVVRDAIRALVARGLVTVRQGRGMSVAMPSDAAFSRALLVLLARSDLTMGDVFLARASIETRLVALAAKSGTDEDGRGSRRFSNSSHVRQPSARMSQQARPTPLSTAASSRRYTSRRWT